MRIDVDKPIEDSCQSNGKLNAECSFLESRALPNGTCLPLTIRQNDSTHGPTPSSAVPAKPRLNGGGRAFLNAPAAQGRPCAPTDNKRSRDRRCHSKWL